MKELLKAGYKLERPPTESFGYLTKVSGPFHLTFTSLGILETSKLDLERSELRYGSADDYKIISDKMPVEELLKLMGCGPLNQTNDGSSWAGCDHGVTLWQVGPTNDIYIAISIDKSGMWR